MAMQEDSDQNLINEVASKYADNEDGKAMQLREQYMNLQYQQQSILRPVSGKSNSNRYT